MSGSKRVMTNHLCSELIAGPCLPFLLISRKQVHKDEVDNDDDYYGGKWHS